MLRLRPHCFCHVVSGASSGSWCHQWPHHLWNSGQVAVSLPPAALLHVLRDRQGLYHLPSKCACHSWAADLEGWTSSSFGFIHGSDHGVLWRQLLEDGMIRALPKGSHWITEPVAAPVKEHCRKNKNIVFRSQCS